MSTVLRSAPAQNAWRFVRWPAVVGLVIGGVAAVVVPATSEPVVATVPDGVRVESVIATHLLDDTVSVGDRVHVVVGVGAQDVRPEGVVELRSDGQVLDRLDLEVGIGRSSFRIDRPGDLELTAVYLGNDAVAASAAVPVVVHVR